MKMSRKRKHVESTERGATLFEFAIVITILLMFIFGIVDFGRALYAYHFVANAAREATRYASVRGTSCTGLPDCGATTSTVTTYVQGLGTGIGIANPASLYASLSPQDPPNSGMNCTGTPIQPGCVAEVTVSYPFSFILPFLPKSTCSRSYPLASGSVCMYSTSEMVVSQ